MGNGKLYVYFTAMQMVIPKFKLIYLFFGLLLATGPQLLAQSYTFNLSQTDNKIFFTDTVVIDGFKTLQKDSIVAYLYQKYKSKSLPITYKDSTAAYVMSYTLLDRKSILWFTAKFQKEELKTKLILFQFELQEPEDYNTPTPAKTPLEELYGKYLKNKKAGSRIAYEALFDEMHRAISQLKIDLAKLIITR